MTPSTFKPQNYIPVVTSTNEPNTIFRPQTTNTPSNEWIINTKYNRNDIVNYKGNYYKCLQSHTSIETWNPSIALSLWQML